MKRQDERTIHCQYERCQASMLTKASFGRSSKLKRSTFYYRGSKFESEVKAAHSDGSKGFGLIASVTSHHVDAGSATPCAIIRFPSGVIIACYAKLAIDLMRALIQ